MPPWKEELIAPRKVGSGVAMLAKVVMGVILFGGRPGLKHNLILDCRRQSSERSVILNSHKTTPELFVPFV